MAPIIRKLGIVITLFPSSIYFLTADSQLRQFPTFEALTEKGEQAIRRFANIPKEILVLCGLPAALAQAA